MIYQSEFAVNQAEVPQAFTAGAVVAHTAEYVIPAGVTIATTDIIELSVLPADHRIVDAIVIPTGNFGTATADVGIMSGEVGSKDNTRTSDDVIFDDAALTGFVRLAKSSGLILEPSDTDRSIGVKFSAAVTGAGQVLRIQFLMAQ